MYLSLRHPSFSLLEFSLQVAGTGEHLPPRVVGYSQELERHRGLIQPTRRELPQNSAGRGPPSWFRSQCVLCCIPRSPPEAPVLISLLNCSPARCPRTYPQHSLEQLLCRRLLTQFRKSSSPSHKSWGELQVLALHIANWWSRQRGAPGREQWQNRDLGCFLVLRSPRSCCG